MTVDKGTIEGKLGAILCLDWYYSCGKLPYSNFLLMTKTSFAIEKPRELGPDGDILVRTKIFEKYRCEESNARNTVAGFVNSKKPDEKFKNHKTFDLKNDPLP